MSWIKTVSYEDSHGRLRSLYDRVKGPNDNVDNIMMLHSLRPHTMEGHMAIYKYVLHHTNNVVPKWFLETLGVWVSHLNKCSYCVDHHFEGLKRALVDNTKAQSIRNAIEQNNISAAPLNEKEKSAMFYAQILNESPSELTEKNIKELRNVGCDDGEILELNQVCAYFSYANRTVLGLGCSIDGDIIGLSPNNSEDPNDWSHS